MKESMTLTVILDTSPDQIYFAWLNSEQHTQMTGGEAECGNSVGDNFTTWDGYIFGKNLELTLNKEIIQSWRTTEFDDKDEDSKLIIRLEEVKEGTLLTLIHSNIPEGQTQYKEGWEEHYFKPMQEFFEDK